MSERKMALGVFVAYHHVGGWRHPDAHPDAMQRLDTMKHLAQSAERGLFDLFFLADGLAVSPDAPPTGLARFEPLTLLSYLAGFTRHIGLAATVSTTYGEPYHIARFFGSLDHLSGGRAAWNVVTSSSSKAAFNFSQDAPLEHDQRYERAHEFVEVVKGLWDSWERDAFVLDKAAGVFFDKSKLHTLHHQGKYFSVQGPLNVPRPPQGHPIIIQAGSSGPGQELAARTADLVFTAQRDFDDARIFYSRVKQLAASYGRSPEHIKILPGVFPVIGRTEREAKEKFELLQSFINLQHGLSALSKRLGQDVSVYPLDEPLPDLPRTNGIQSRAELLIKLARREGLTIRQLALEAGGAKGHRIIVGSAQQIADRLEEWFVGRAADGFNIMPSHLPGGLDEFVDEVVPELQERGLFKTAYEGGMLREQLGLPSLAPKVRL
jgi:FMN-dependent oxidoreductase (nitrilotriacetate monooxygenase family)